MLIGMADQQWTSIPRQAPLQPVNTNVLMPSAVQSVIDEFNGMSLNSSGPSQMYTVPAPGRIARRTRGVFPPPRRARCAAVVEPEKIDDTDTEMETQM